MVHLASARYGKDNIRVLKVHRDEKTGVHTVTEMTVCVLLAGEIDTSYTRADNSPVVATDTMKQTVYILAKQHPVNPPELFASIVASHFVKTYPHIHVATVSVIVHRWTRMSVDGKLHPHSFYRDGADTRNAEAVARSNGEISVKSSISGLLVLKSTGSAFYGFHRDEYTQLPETWDRILSTSIDCSWQWKSLSGLEEVQKLAATDANCGFDAGFDAARSITMKLFAEDNSASVQNTMYKMCETIIAAVPGVDTVNYSLPNKHNFDIDLSWFKGLQNLGKDAEVYAPQTDPNGLIQCSVSRNSAAKAPELLRRATGNSHL